MFDLQQLSIWDKSKNLLIWRALLEYQRRVCYNLNLEEQLQLWHATDSTTRLSLAVLKAWQSQSKYCLHWNESLEDKEAVFHNFLSFISSTVVELHLAGFPLVKLEVFRNHCFYNTRQLEYSREDSDHDDDTDMEILVICFPLIESFKMSGNGSGQHVAGWEHLQRLDITEASENWQKKYFQKVCLQCPLKFLCVRWCRESMEDAYVESISKLQGLEELHLEFNQLSKENTSKLLSLPKLRKFRFDEFENVEDLLNEVVEIRGEEVVALTCNENFWLWLNPNRFKNVRELAIIDEGVVEGIWCAESFNEALMEFPRLEKLYLENTSVWSDGEEFWDTVSSCPQLKLLHLTNLNIEEDKLFQFSEETVQKALSLRNEPLAIHFVKTGCEDLIYQFFRHPKLKISCISILDDYPNLTGGVLEMEIIPLLMS